MANRVSTKAVKFFKENGLVLDARKGWDESLDTVLEKFNIELEIYTSAPRNGDMTKLLVTRDNKELLNLRIPNKEAWKEIDWRWDFIGKLVLEYLMKSHMGKRKCKGDWQKYVA